MTLTLTVVVGTPSAKLRSFTTSSPSHSSRDQLCFLADVFLQAAGHLGLHTGRVQRMQVFAQQRKDPTANPEYRRGSSNTYYRKRLETGKSRKGTSVSNDNEKRRRGRPAHMRSPDDTPLRDGNRDRLMGLLTDRATQSLVHGVHETNPSLHSWLTLYLQSNSIPENGDWSDVSGENFLRKLLTSPVEQISGSFEGADASFANASPVGGDPRQIAQRIMDIRHHIAREWMEDLRQVKEANTLLIRESLMSSLNASASGGSELEAVPAGDAKVRSSRPEQAEHDKGGDDTVAGKEE